VHAELRLGRGIVVGHGAVELLMRRAGLVGLPGTRNRRLKPDTPTAADLVDRKFSRDRADLLWVTDITEHPTREGKVYCAVVLDVYSRRVVSWSIDSSQTAQSPRLEDASRSLSETATIAPTRRWCDDRLKFGQFRSRQYVEALRHNGLVGSMGRVGACGDNAAMESFFALLQKNVLDRRRWATREQLRLAIVAWIEHTYHRRRRQARLGRLTPIEFETVNTAA
jgi:transposase InsO family protein